MLDCPNSNKDLPLLTVDTLLGGKLRSGGSSALTSNGKLRRRNRLGPIVPRRRPLMANLAAGGGVQAAIQTKKEEENPVSERSTSTSKDTLEASAERKRKTGEKSTELLSIRSTF